MNGEPLQEIVFEIDWQHRHCELCDELFEGPWQLLWPHRGIRLSDLQCDFVLHALTHHPEARTEMLLVAPDIWEDPAKGMIDIMQYKEETQLWLLGRRRCVAQGGPLDENWMWVITDPDFRVYMLNTGDAYLLDEEPDPAVLVYHPELSPSNASLN